ncbi:MAG: type ISP restriction/modification enzyme [Minisyncoccales bacterium]
MTDDLFQNYIKEIYKLIERGDAREESFYSALEILIKNYGQSLKKKTEVTILPKKSKAGNPDFRVWDGESMITGYIEAKQPFERNLEYVESSEQLKRYREAYPNLILTNFLEFRLYKNGEYWKKVNIGSSQLAKISPEQEIVLHKEELQELLNLFFDFTQPRIRTPKVLAEILSKKAKIMREYIILPSLLEEKETYFSTLYNSFRTHLIKDLTGDAFADLFAQTFTYGLFIAKYQYEAEGNLFGKKSSSLPFTTKTAYDFIQKSFGILREIFRVMSTEDMPKRLEIMVDDIIDILNHTDIHKLFAYYNEGKRKDPIYHLYETFLLNYDPERKKKLGIYYTPLEVVSFIVNSVDSILKDKKLFQAQDGLATYETDSLENSVTVLDPAVGTGTFFVEAIEKAIEEVKNRYSESKDFINQFIRNHILKHFFAFEILIAPYVVSHLKTLFNLTNKHHFEFTEKDALNIFLTNTLEFHRKETEGGFVGLFEKTLVTAQEKALKIKTKNPILIIIGNPPYSVSSQNKVDPKTEFGKFYESYKESVRKEEKNIQPLSDDYIKFLAFAHWKIKQTGKGIVGMITNNSYLDGLIHRDMRKKLYDDFDLIYILNLHGDAKRPKITKDNKRDKNVFDIKQGVAIGIFIKPEEKIEKQVFYHELIGQREEKYKFLDNHNVSNVEWVKLEPKEPFWFFVPKEFGEEKYKNFVSISEVFNKFNAGIATGKDDILVDFHKNSLLKRLTIKDEENFSFLLKEKGVKDKNLIDRRISDLENQILPYFYRPFDIRFTIYNKIILQRARTNLMNNLLKPNIAIITTKILSSETFQHLLVANGIGDRTYISTRGREANYYFPLWLYNSENKTQGELLISAQQEPKTSNIKREIIDLLSSSYKNSVPPEEIFYYIYAVLYSNTYRQKYLEFLKIDFPRVPFTKNYELFKKLSRFGKELVDIHLLQSPSLDKTSAKFEGEGELSSVKKIIYNQKEKRVYINENQFFANVEPEVWNYFIGGYQVLNKWLKDRKGRSLTDEEIKTYIKIISALSQTILTQKEIDKLYREVEEDLIML